MRNEEKRKGSGISESSNGSLKGNQFDSSGLWALGEGMVEVKGGEVNSGNTVDEGLLRRE